MAGSRDYPAALPEGFHLERVVVVHRHGDRAQIARSIGPKFPEEEERAALWKTKLPSPLTVATMASVAHSTYDVTAFARTGKRDTTETTSLSLIDEVYSGEDSTSNPYAQLTEVGAQQLFKLGTELRRRYEAEGVPLNAEAIYARSTNMCRTLQSLRSLLVGLLGGSSLETPLNLQQKVRINTRPKATEFMFPAADGPCEAMVQRRSVIFPEGFMEENLPGYPALEARMKQALGYEGKVSWLTVKEILTCSKVHGLVYPAGVEEEDEKQISHLAGWMWGKLYSDAELNRLAIGRFLGEVLGDLTNAALANKSVFLYSGHDSTLVPLLCALGCHDDVWPPYASSLALEIATSSSSGERLVRAIYNDQEVEMKAVDASGGKGRWCRYGALLDRLKEMSISEDDYRDVCRLGSAASSALPHIESEVRATIG
jgi:hypothetical protein